MKNLKWRYATKKFDADKSLSEEQLHSLVEIARHAPTSFGLQPFHLHVISDKDRLSELQVASYGQAQIGDCSHLFVFSVKNQINDQSVDHYISKASSVHNVPVAQLETYSATIKGFLANKSENQKIEWAQKQAYLALGFLLAGSAELQIDTCPMEGFVSTEYDRILNLEEQGLRSTVVMAAGFRSIADQKQHAKKVRKEISEFVDFL